MIPSLQFAGDPLKGEQEELRIFPVCVQFPEKRVGGELSVFEQAPAEAAASWAMVSQTLLASSEVKAGPPVPDSR